MIANILGVYQANTNFGNFTYYIIVCKTRIQHQKGVMAVLN